MAVCAYGWVCGLRCCGGGGERWKTVAEKLRVLSAAYDLKHNHILGITLESAVCRREESIYFEGSTVA